LAQRAISKLLDHQSRAVAERLDSWKEIAAYLRKDVRTVQRWEKHESLPVHRRVHATQGSVYAYKVELDAWWSKIPLRTMVAVLPFENLSRDPAQEYFSDGLTDEMIAQLGRLTPTGLGVIARTSSMRYKHTPKAIDEIARELGVDYILEGGVRRAGNHIRITTQLIQTSDQTQIWTEIYERDEQDVLILQREIAGRIARSLAVQILPAQRATPRNETRIRPIAHEAYLKGLYCWNKMAVESVSKAIDYFKQAVREDMRYALAYSGLADCYTMLGFYDVLPPKDAMTKAESAAIEALRLDETLGEAHASLARVKHFFYWDWDGAEREYLRAIELCPGYSTAHRWYGDYLTTRGRHDEALAEVKQALALDPVSPVINVWLAMTHYYRGEYDLAIRQCQNTAEMDPYNALARRALGLAYQAKGMYAAAVKQLQKAVLLSDGSPWMTAELGCAFAAGGRNHEALRILNRLKVQSKNARVFSFNIALIYAALDEADDSFAWLCKAEKAHSLRLPYMAVEPRLNRLHFDPRFRQILDRLSAT
jgi:TolB-like protein